jgi:peroxiredoxin
MESGMKIARLFLGLLVGWVSMAAWAESPDIPLKTLDGKTRNVSEFIGHGKWTVVVVWAHDCHICGAEIHEMTDFHQAHQAKDAVVLGVTIDGFDQVKEARQFVEKHKLPFVNLIAEPSQDVLMKFGGGQFVGTPTYYVYNPKGEIVGRNIGPVSRQEVETFMTTPDQPVDAGKS